MKYSFYFLVALITLASCKKDDDETSDPWRLSPGASARDILSDSKYKQLKFEVVYPAGYAPPSAAVQELEDFVEKYCHKPGGVSTELRQMSGQPTQAYSLSDIRELEDEERKSYGSADNEIFTIYIFMANGEFVQNSDTLKTLGIAYYNSSFVIFQETIQENSGGLGRPSEAQLTASVLKHEMGHLLGLVNIGSNMQENHEDPDHPSHCNVSNCLMHWSLATTASLLGSSTRELHSGCEADLRANGGK